MKILFAAAPAAGHLNPLLAIARIVLERGDDAVVMTGSYLRHVVEDAGIRFRPLSGEADMDLSRPEDIMPERLRLPPGPALIQYVRKSAFLDPMAAQLASLRAAIAEEAPDAVVTDSHFTGRLALFLDQKRPAIPLIACGVSFLPLDRPDRASPNLGLPPARDPEALARYAKIAAESETALEQPIRSYADAKLAELCLPALPFSYTASFGQLADVYLHPTARSFEYDYGELPEHVRFVGPLPPPPRRGAPPGWWAELDGAKQIVLVTQGTVANADFDDLVAPALAALADRDDLIVVVTTGGREIADIHADIPRNARIAEFLDYRLLMPKLSALVTNGGYGTISQALSVGVPVVAAGRTEDKAEVGARVAWSGVGVEIPKQRPSSDEIRMAVDELLSVPSYRDRARAIATEMASIDTRAEILMVIDGLVDGTIPRRGSFGYASVMGSEGP